MFWSAGSSFLRAEGFYWDLGISKLQLFMKKISIFFQLYIFWGAPFTFKFPQLGIGIKDDATDTGIPASSI